MSWDSFSHIPGSHAPAYSRDVEAASEAVRDAERRLVSALEAAYPLDTRVRVVHYRGQFFGRVTGWDCNGCRVLVRNCVSGKVGKWWAAHVEVAYDH